MTIKIKGRYSEDNQNCVPGEWTTDEINQLLEQGHHGMLMFEEVFGTYEINGIECSATGLSIGDETFVYEKDGKIVVPTFFAKGNIAMEGDPNEKVKVDVIIDPVKHPLFVSIVNI